MQVNILLLGMRRTRLTSFENGDKRWHWRINNDKMPSFGNIDNWCHGMNSKEKLNFNDIIDTVVESTKKSKAMKR